MSANDRTGVGNGTAEWMTPPDLYLRLDRRFHFNYDAFASHENTRVLLVDRLEDRHLYSTPEGTWRQYPGRYGGESWETGCEQLSDRDGLSEPWEGRRVYMNPPYTRGLIEQCVEKAWIERDRADIIVALLPAATETRWFQEFILPYCHIDWLPRRVRYIDPRTGKPGPSPPSGSVIAVFRAQLMPMAGRRAAIQDADRREREYCLPGWVRDAIREGRQGADPYAAEPCQECGQRLVVARVGRCLNCRVEVE